MHGNKPTMCSVLFMDIVEYSRKTVSEQISLKERFNAILSNAIRNVPVGDRIVLDTGDGAAICFLGEPGDALKAALLLRDGVLNVGAHVDPPLLVRLGINYGPVRLVKTPSEQPNIVGDGINVALRVKGFSSPGQILASRSYYDVVSRASGEYAAMFKHEGLRTDKHVREHELYAIAPPHESATAEQKQPAFAAPAAPGTPAPVSPPSVWKRRTIYGAAIALLFIALFELMNRAPEQIITEQAPSTAVAPAPAVASQAVVADAGIPGEVATALMGQKQEAAQSAVRATETAAKPAGQVPQAAFPAPRKMPAHPEQAKAGKQQQTLPLTSEEITAAGQVGVARVSIAATPWGEVYLDGKMRGISPPLVELHVTPGKHEIEIRNTTFPVYRQSIQIKSGEKIKVRHKFSN